MLARVTPMLPSIRIPSVHTISRYGPSAHCRLWVWWNFSSTFSKFLCSGHSRWIKYFYDWKTTIQTLSLMQVKVKGWPPSSSSTKKSCLGWPHCRATYSDTALLTASSQLADYEQKPEPAPCWGSVLEHVQIYLDINPGCHIVQADNAQRWSWGLVKMTWQQLMSSPF